MFAAASEHSKQTREDDKEYTIKAELPGVNKEDVKVTVEGGCPLDHWRA
jgi:HSP20 family molecular chaperone IbpA